MIFWYGIAQATAWRTFRLSKGGFVTFMPMYWMPFEYGVDTMASFGCDLQLGKILVRQIVGDVGVAALEERAPVAGRRHHPPHDALAARERAVLPARRCARRPARAGRPFRDAVGAAAGGVLLRVFEPPGVVRAGVLLDELRVDDAGHDHGKVWNREAVLAQHVDPERAVVDDDELLGLLERAGLHLKGRKAADRDGTVERPFDVLRRYRRAVLEDRVRRSRKVTDMSPAFMSSASSGLNLSRS